MILFGESAVRKATAEFMAHYRSERNHQDFDNALIYPKPEHAACEVHRRERLGGLLNYSYRKAAENHPDLRTGYMVSHGRLHLNSLHSSRDRWWNIEQGIDRQPEMDTSPYWSDCTDHFRTAQDRTIDFSDTTGLDPMSGETVPLFHPTWQMWSEHFRLNEYEIEGLTATGRATVLTLVLNYPRRQLIRQVEETFGLYPPPVTTENTV
jgi:hypothetical protein